MEQRHIQCTTPVLKVNNETPLTTRPDCWACITYLNRGSSDQMRERCNDPKFKEEFLEWLKREIEKYNYHGSKIFTRHN